MVNSIESTLDLYAAQLTTSRNFITAWISGVERINQVLLDTTKIILHRQMTHIEAWNVALDLSGMMVLKDMYGQSNYDLILLHYAEQLQGWGKISSAMIDSLQSLVEKLCAFQLSIDAEKLSATNPLLIEPFGHLIKILQAQSNSPFLWSSKPQRKIALKHDENIIEAECPPNAWRPVPEA